MPVHEEVNFQEGFDPNELMELVGGQELPQEKTPSLPIEETNLAEDIDDEELDKISRQVIKDYEFDLDSYSEHEEKHAEWLKLYYQTDTVKNPPWDGASEESVPTMTEAVNQFQSRTYKAFFPNRYFIDALPVGKNNTGARERAERIAGHMNFQLGVKDRTYKRNKNQMFQAVALVMYLAFRR